MIWFKYMLWYMLQVLCMVDALVHGIFFDILLAIHHQCYGIYIWHILWYIIDACYTTYVGTWLMDDMVQVLV
jgi:hypothetical protein